ESQAGEFPTQEAALSALSEALRERDFEKFEAHAGEGSISELVKPKVKALVEDATLAVPADKPFVEISKSAHSARWAIRFVPETGDAVRELYVDLRNLAAAESADTAATGFEIAKISLPLLLSALPPAEDPAATATAPQAAPDGSQAPVVRGAAPSPAAIPAEEAADALTIAHAFSRAVASRDF